MSSNGGQSADARRQSSCSERHRAKRSSGNALGVTCEVLGGRAMRVARPERKRLTYDRGVSHDHYTSAEACAWSAEAAWTAIDRGEDAH
jgi:hypothetical protein